MTHHITAESAGKGEVFIPETITIERSHPRSKRPQTIQVAAGGTTMSVGKAVALGIDPKTGRATRDLKDPSATAIEAAGGEAAKPVAPVKKARAKTVKKVAKGGKKSKK